MESLDRRDFVAASIDRLTQYYGTRGNACEKIGRTQSYMNMIVAGSRGVSDKLLVQIRDATGYDFYDQSTLELPPVEFRTGGSVRIVEETNEMRVPLVTSYAYAGYRRGFADEEYIDSLPTVAFTVSGYHKGNYVAFEVAGDSMYDGSVDSLLQGDILLCREVAHHHWRDKLHIRKWYFVIVHKQDGVLVKQITEHDTDLGYITIHSLNRDYPDERIHLDDIAQLFNVVRVNRTM